jgi:hypothetical protein
LAAHQGRLIGGRHHHDRAGQARITQIVLQKLLDLAAALADQPDHRDIGHDIARQHREQHRLADARAREDAHALAMAAGDEGVQRADTKVDRGTDPLACMGRRRRRPERIRQRARLQRALAIDRLAHGVHHPPEPGLGRPHRCPHRRHHGAATAPDPFERSERHQQSMTAGKTDHLARDRYEPALGLRLDDDTRADRHGMQRTRHLHHQATHADHPAVNLVFVQFLDLL